MRLQSERDSYLPPASCLEDDLSASAATDSEAVSRSGAALIVEVDTGSASSRGRPPERAFMIRLRRADASVIVTVGLSRVAAERLADHIADVVGGSRPATGES
jgi:hypothetical protein